jgi:cytochrome P450
MADPGPRIDPPVPTAGGPLPRLAGAAGLLWDPADFFDRQRRRHGDTFVVDAFGHRLFCVFSPDGVSSLYAQPEDRASFGIATYTLIKAKVPLELLLGRRNHPKTLFGSQKVENYLDNLRGAVELETGRLGRAGTFEVFGEMKRLGHRLGLASWAGSEAASPRYVDQLIPLFDRLDSSESFVRPARTLVTWATRKRWERSAMAGIERILGQIWEERRSRPPVDDFLQQIFDSYADLPPADQAVGAARDVIVIHMGSQSNLYAALAWTLINLLLRPDLMARVRAGDDALLDQCANESIRMAQRSITLRQVLTAIEVESGGTRRVADHHAGQPQHHRRPRPRTVRPRSLPGPAPGSGGGRRTQGDGEHLRPRRALVPCGPLLDLRHPHLHPRAARSVRARAAVHHRLAPQAAGRRGGPGRTTLPGAIPEPLTLDAGRRQSPPRY